MTQMDKNKQEDKIVKGKDALNTYARLSTLILQIVAVVIIGGWGGRELDRWLGLSFPLFTLLFLLITACWGFYFLVKTMLKK